MKNHQLTIALVVGMILGCAGAQVARVTVADAQPPGEGSLSECVIYRGLTIDSDFDDLDGNAKSIRGWTPVGGTQDGVVLCR